MSEAPNTENEQCSADGFAPPTGEQPAFRRPTLDDAWLLLIPLGLLAVAAYSSTPPHDFWWHLRTGQIIAQSRSIPTVDLFTYTQPGAPWMNQAWLSQIGMYLTYQTGGSALITTVHAFLIACGYALAALAAVRASRDAPAAAIGTLAAAASGIFAWAVVRPQSISFLLFGTLVWIIEADRSAARRALWGLPFLFAFWANLHAAFIFGLLLLGLYVIARFADALAARRRPTGADFALLVLALASVLAISLNPAGPAGMARYLLGFMQSHTTQQYNEEFQPLALRSQAGIVYFGIAATVFLIGYVRRIRIPLYHLLALMVFGALSLYYVRAVPWFGMAAAPAFALIISGKPRPVRQGRAAFNAAFLILLTLLALLNLPAARRHLPSTPGVGHPVEKNSTPWAAAEALCQMGGSPRVFNEIGFGSYLEWACPALPVFVDTRFELYDDALWQDYINVSVARWDWEAILARYGVNAILLSKADRADQQSLIDAARASGAWRVKYEDDAAILFVKLPASTAG
jgi:hypothetical protein